MEALKIKKPERSAAQAEVPAKAREVKKVKDDARKAEQEKAKAERRFDKALEVLQSLKMAAPEVPAPVTPAPKKKRVAAPPPPPPPDLSEEDYSSEDDTPVEKAKPRPTPTLNVQRRQIVFC